MVNENLEDFMEKSKKLRIAPEVRSEIKMLHKLGVDIHELEYLAYVKMKEEEIALKEA